MIMKIYRSAAKAVNKIKDKILKIIAILNLYNRNLNMNYNNFKGLYKKSNKILLEDNYISLYMLYSNKWP